MMYNIELDYDEDELLLEAEIVEYKPFESGFRTGSFFDHAPSWMQGHVHEVENFKEVKRLKNYIEEKINSNDVRPRFYRQEKNTEVPPHVDLNTKCAINIVLSDNYGPIKFTGNDSLFYKCAVLDTTKEHSVPPFPEERILLKFSIFDVSYEDVIKKF
tara:strand:+ start:5905 stop:6378 length:474 start_codon:yes stop_codon:yes gene_type:complete